MSYRLYPKVARSHKYYTAITDLRAECRELEERLSSESEARRVVEGERNALEDELDRERSK